jgi:asparagine synthase (glutamine-hydrolysing)
MCGIAGLLDFTRSSTTARLTQLARDMADSLTHRGPDEGGTWVDEAAGIALGHRRLAIVDLTTAGRQPMTSASGRFIVSYNGEIYNSAELRTQLAPNVGQWRGHSDTETLVEAIAAWGLKRTIAECNGMFAIAVFDRETRTLSLVRDRIGKKPLYWTKQNNVLLFGSELRALRCHPEFKPTINRDSLIGFVRRGHYLADESVYSSVTQVEPGHILTIKPIGQTSSAPYWTLPVAINKARTTPFQGSPADAIARLESLLTNAVTTRMVADVPLGAFLSGGYDSSTIVALMQAATNTQVRTFSIGFEDKNYNEAPHAKAVARHLKTDHTELIVTAADTRAVIPKLAEIFDEPFADSSQIPTFLVSQMARQHVTVALSGDGGDELFAGYNRYALGERIHARLGCLPPALRRAVAGGLSATPLQTLDRLGRLIPASLRPTYLGDKLHKFAGVMTKDTPGIYRQLISQWPDCEGVVIGGTERHWPSPELTQALPTDTIELMQALDTLSYLPGDILTKVDRASMAVSLEARCPLLDTDVVEFAWSLPADLKIRDGQAKWILRQVLYNHVPPALVDRPKAGFSIPVGGWLKTSLRDWAEDLLDESKLRQTGLLDPKPIRALWQQHLDGRRNGQYALWSILMFEDWRRKHA